MSASDRRADTARRATRLGAPVLVIAFLVTVTVAWSYANPPGYAPDEPAHYTKAVGVGEGQWVGEPGRYPVGPGFGPAQLEWINKAARVVQVPANLAPDFFACSIFQPDRSAACLNTAPDPPAHRVPRLTYVGTYEPFVYLLPGLVMARAGDAVQALALGRTISGGISLGLLVLAVLVLWRPGAGALPLVGLVVAVTPMVVFLVSGFAPSGPELAGAVCLSAVVWRLARSEPPTALVWVALALAGTTVAVSRSSGPFFVAANVALFLLLLRPGPALAVVRRGGRAAAASLGLVVVGLGANVAWGLAVQPQPDLDAGRVLSWVGRSFSEIPGVLREDVGVFGWADVRMPAIAYGAWALLAAGLLALAFRLGGSRERLVLAAVIAGCVLGTVGLAAAIIHQTNFPMYGRYALPLWVIVPIGAGEVVLAHRDRLEPVLARAVVGTTVVVAGIVHFVGFWANARRYAVSDHGPVFFLGRSQWSPAGGWKVWVLLVAVGVVSLMAYPLLAERESRSAVRVGS